MTHPDVTHPDVTHPDVTHPDVTHPDVTQYTLKIDGETAGSFTAEQLAHGVNLAELPTPMVRQAAEVHALTLRHNSIHAARWRQVQVPLEKNYSASVSKALDALDELEADIVKQQRAAAMPKARRFELSVEMRSWCSYGFSGVKRRAAELMQ